MVDQLLIFNIYFAASESIMTISKLLSNLPKISNVSGFSHVLLHLISNFIGCQKQFTSFLFHSYDIYLKYSNNRFTINNMKNIIFTQGKL